MPDIKDSARAAWHIIGHRTGDGAVSGAVDSATGEHVPKRDVVTLQNRARLRVILVVTPARAWLANRPRSDSADVRNTCRAQDFGEASCWRARGFRHRPGNRVAVDAQAWMTAIWQASIGQRIVVALCGVTRRRRGDVDVNQDVWQCRFSTSMALAMTVCANADEG